MCPKSTFSVLFAFVRVVDAAGLEADDLPLAVAAVVDAGVAVLSADIAGSVGAFEGGLGGYNGRIAVDADFEVVQVEGGDVEGAGTAKTGWVSVQRAKHSSKRHTPGGAESWVRTRKSLPMCVMDGSPL